MSTKARIEAIRNSKFTPPFEVLGQNHIVTNDACTVELTLKIQDDIFLFTGSARRAPGDESNFEVGYFMALQRAWNSAGVKLRKRAYGLMKHSDDMQALRAKQRAEKATKKTKVAKKATTKAKETKKSTATSKA